jgi:GDP-L-fucose synthase
MGATGLVGRHVVELLESDGRHRIVATHHVREPYDTAGVSWMKCDLRDPDQTMRALESVESAVLCAGQLSTSAILSRDPITSVLSTLRIYTNLLEAAARLRLRRVILISSCTGYPSSQRAAVEDDMAVGDPPAQWFGVGWMHRYVEQQLRWYVEHLGLIGSAVVLRPTLVFGPYDDFSPETGHFVPTLIRKVVERVRPIDIWGDGTQERNLLHAADLAEAVLAALNLGVRGFEAFNVVSPTAMSVNEVLQHLVEIDGFSDAVLSHDLKRAGGPSVLRVSGDSFAAATGWQAKRGGRQGLADTLSWYRRSRAGGAA